MELPNATPQQLAELGQMRCPYCQELFSNEPGTRHERADHGFIVLPHSLGASLRFDGEAGSGDAR